MDLILKKNYENLVVVSLDNGVSFIHDNKTGKNYFNREAIANCLGTNMESVHKGIQRYMTKWTICPVNIQLVGSDKPVEFYPFRVLSYLAHRSRSDKATEVVNYIEDAIDEKFNRDTGFKQPVVKQPWVDRLANAMSIDKVQQQEIIQELENQVLSLSNRLGEYRATNNEVEHLQREDIRNKIEIADLYERLSRLEGNYYRRKLEEIDAIVHQSLDKWMVTENE